MDEVDRQRLVFLSDRQLAREATAYAAQHLYDYAVNDNCQVILELGVRTGVSTRIFLLACKVTGGHLWSVDLGGIRVENIHYGENWGLKEYWTYTTYTNDLHYEWDQPIDLLFIDTSHTYDQTLAELEKFAPYVRNGKRILLHDSLLDHIEGWGVQRAITTFIKRYPHYSYYETGVQGGLAVLTKYCLHTSYTVV